MNTTPESVFFGAQGAIAQEDWESFFSFLDRNDLLKIAANIVNSLINGSASPCVLAELGKQNGLPEDLVPRLRE